MDIECPDTSRHLNQEPIASLVCCALLCNLLLPRLFHSSLYPGIALFRALLSRCRHARVDESIRQTSQKVVRNSFRRNRYVQSKVELKKAFNAGYEVGLALLQELYSTPLLTLLKALNLLAASASGDDASNTRIKELLANTPSYLTRSPSQAAAPKRPLPKGNPLNPDSSQLLSRPRPHVSGERHIPILVSAANSPMLRFKKPQPENLSTYLNKKRDKMQQRAYLSNDLENLVMLGSWEDEWDRLIQEAALEQDVLMPGHWEPGEGMSWAWAYRHGIWYLRDKIHMHYRKGVELTRKMEEVIEREKALKAKEEAEREGKDQLQS